VPEVTGASRTRCAGRSDCVELGNLEEGGVAVRNSTRPDAGTVIFMESEFDAFAGDAKDGDFDR
jgi:hypothetical protein